MASDGLAAGAEVAPFVVLKDWGDCQVERFGDGELERARSRMREVLRGAPGTVHCALAHVEPGAGDAGHEGTIVVEVGRAPGDDGEAAERFVQRFRPRRGRFRPFKLIGEISLSRAGDRESGMGQTSESGLAESAARP